MSLDFRLRNQISKRKPLSPEFSVRPMSAVCQKKGERSINWGSSRSRKGKLCLHPVAELPPARQTQREGAQGSEQEQEGYGHRRAETAQAIPRASSRVSSTSLPHTHSAFPSHSASPKTLSPHLTARRRPRK